MSRKKLNIIMFALTFILLCLIIFCLIFMDEIKERINGPDTPDAGTTDPYWQTESGSEKTEPTYTMGTLPEGTDATVETTEATVPETTEATTVPTTEPETTVPDTDPDIGESAAEIARQQVGKAYKYGGQGPDEFDTSGLIFYCYQQIGVATPRNSKALAEFGYEVSKEEIRPGDVVFFWSSEAGKPEYMGMYVGDGIVVAALNSSKPVVQFNMNSAYYTEHFVFIRRMY